MDGRTAQSPLAVNGGMDRDFYLLVKSWFCQRSNLLLMSVHAHSLQKSTPLCQLKRNTDLTGAVQKDCAVESKAKYTYPSFLLMPVVVTILCLCVSAFSLCSEMKFLKPVCEEQFAFS